MYAYTCIGLNAANIVSNFISQFPEAQAQASGNTRKMDAFATSI